jgi:hypothetical protein
MIEKSFCQVLCPKPLLFILPVPSSSWRIPPDEERERQIYMPSPCHSRENSFPHTLASKNFREDIINDKKSLSYSATSSDNTLFRFILEKDEEHSFCQVRRPKPVLSILLINRRQGYFLPMKSVKGKYICHLYVIRVGTRSPTIHRL